MKQTKHIRGVNNLVEEINNIQNKQECQAMEYNVLLICFYVKSLKLKGNVS